MKFETLFIYVFLLRELIVSHHWLYGAFMHAFHKAILKNNNATKIDKISGRKFKGSKRGLENDKLYYQRHRHTFYSSRIFLDRKMLYLKARFSLLQRGAF